MDKPLSECTPYFIWRLYPESFKRMEAVQRAHNSGSPAYVESALKELTDEELEHPSMRQYFSSSTSVLEELFRRYNNNKKNELKIYGGHCGGCQGRPCTCGFEGVWKSIT